MQLTHPVRVAARQVVVDRHEMDTTPGEPVEVRRQRRHERLAFAGLHLGDPSQVQRGAAHELHVEVALTQHPAPGLTHGGERVGQDLVQHVDDQLLAVLGVLPRRPGLVDPLPELVGPGAQLLVGEPLDLGLERVDLGHDGLDRFESPTFARVENFLDQTHAATTSGPLSAV